MLGPQAAVQGEGTILQAMGGNRGVADVDRGTCDRSRDGILTYQPISLQSGLVWDYASWEAYQKVS